MASQVLRWACGIRLNSPSTSELDLSTKAFVNALELGSKIAQRKQHAAKKCKYPWLDNYGN